MAGVVNSWLADVESSDSPCVTNPPTGGTLASNCILWFIAGILIGSLTFEKKHQVGQ